MACQIFNLTGDNAIEQGATFDWLSLYYPADVSTWTPRGQIRKNYAYKTSEIIATFAFSALAYGSYTIGGSTITATKINPILAAAQTSLIPVPKRIPGVDLSAGLTAWVYDIELESSGGKVIRVGSGLVDICPEVST